jgi:hypothetical protein
MPGMMDTVLNLGINDDTEAALAAESGDAGFARDTHRRFLELYANIVVKATLPEERPARPCQPARRDREPGRGRAGLAARAIAGGGQRGVRFLELAPRAALSPAPRHRRQPRHRGQRAGHGVRQFRR